MLKQLHPNTRCKEVPKDYLTEERDHFRIMLLRNIISHHKYCPFFFRIGSEPRTSLVIDPRKEIQEGSERSAIDELKHFLKLVTDKCQKVIELL